MSEIFADGEIAGAFVVLLFVCSLLYARNIGYLIRRALRK
jgi:hypothetical protein